MFWLVISTEVPILLLCTDTTITLCQPPECQSGVAWDSHYPKAVLSTPAPPRTQCQETSDPTFYVIEHPVEPVTPLGRSR